MRGPATSLATRSFFFPQKEHASHFLPNMVLPPSGAILLHALCATSGYVSDAAIDRRIRIVAADDVGDELTQAPRREFFARAHELAKPPPSVPHDVAVLFLRVNGRIRRSRDEEPFVLVGPMPVPNILMPSRPHPPVDRQVEP